MSTSARASSIGVRSAPRSVARRVTGAAPRNEPWQPAQAHAHAAAEDVVAGGLDAVEHRLVDGAGQPDARAHRGGRRGDGGRRGREQPPGARHLVRDQRPQLGRGALAAEVGVGDAEAVAVLGGQVDAVHLVVLADVAHEVGVLERQAEPPVVGVVVARDAEQRRHDPPDRAGRALHVAAQLVPAEIRTGAQSTRIERM